MSPQDRLSRLADQLAEGLTFFNHLEPISKKFNSANEDICTSPGFHAMLKQLDESIAYVEKHVRESLLSVVTDFAKPNASQP